MAVKKQANPGVAIMKKVPPNEEKEHVLWLLL